MAAGSTYSQIASTTLGSNTQTVTFNSIPQTYTNLVLVTFIRDANYYTLIRYNNDSSAIYSRTVINASGSAGSSRTTNATSFSLGADPNTSFSITKFNIMNYANNTTFKTALGRQDSPTDSWTGATVNLYRSTNPITRIDITSVSGTASMVTGSTFTLYGIKGA